MGVGRGKLLQYVISLQPQASSSIYVLTPSGRR